MFTYRKRCAILASIAAAAAVALVAAGPIPQDPNYHEFADSRIIGGIPNFWNVLSNVPFLAVGGLGLLRCRRLAYPESAHAYIVLCVGVILTAAGSAFYHYRPTNETLLWDRLPMTVVFMALLSLLLHERVLRAGWPALLWPLVLTGITAALYWSWTESLGRGDLRAYVLVQFLPVLLIPPILILFEQRYLSNALLLWSFGLYLAAKILEHLDAEVLAATSTMSGHALKHLVAATAVLLVIYSVSTESSAETT